MPPGLGWGQGPDPFKVPVYRPGPMGAGRHGGEEDVREDAFEDAEDEDLSNRNGLHITPPFRTPGHTGMPGGNPLCLTHHPQGISLPKAQNEHCDKTGDSRVMFKDLISCFNSRPIYFLH